MPEPLGHCGHPVDWWLCPNAPRCPHGSVLHDVEDWDDPTPRCCVEGCYCGHPDPEASRRLDLALASQRVAAAIARMTPARQILGQVNPC